jgi:hypothetical protein
MVWPFSLNLFWEITSFSDLVGEAGGSGDPESWAHCLHHGPKILGERLSPRIKNTGLSLILDPLSRTHCHHHRPTILGERLSTRKKILVCA